MREHQVRAKTTSLFAALLLASTARAAPTPCWYSTAAAQSPSEYAYDIGRAYGAATLVLVGRARAYVPDAPQIVHVDAVIKGAAGAEITLEGLHRAGTDPWGASIPTSGAFLMMLSGGPVYKWVDPGSACPNAFEVREKRAVIGKKKIKVKDLRRYLESGPILIQ